MDSTQFLLILVIVRLAAAIAMLELYRQLRTRSSLMLSGALAVLCIPPVIGLTTGNAEWHRTAVTAGFNAVATGLLLAGILGHFTMLNVRKILSVGVPVGLLAIVSYLVAPAGTRTFVGMLILLVAAGAVAIRFREPFVRGAGASFHWGLVVVVLTAGQYAMRALMPWLMSGSIDRVMQIIVSTTLGLYLLNLEFNIAVIALRGEESRYRTLFDAAGDVITVVDLQGTILDVNQAGTDKLGYSHSELVGKPITEIDSPDDVPHVGDRIHAIRQNGQSVFESQHVRKDGTTFPVEVNARLIESSGSPAILGVIRDMTERKHSEELIAQMAYFDPLTGLANRRLCSDRLSRAISHARRTDQGLAVLFIDLDHFKAVNDSLGHATGDLLLVAVADRLKALVRQGDTVARFGGDEFMLVLIDVSTEEAVSTVAWKVLEGLQAPFMIDDQEIVTTASMGIAMSDGEHSAEELVRDADIAMYAAKGRGRNTYQFHDPELNSIARERFAIKNDLRTAFERGELEVHYQPQVRLSDRTVVGVEALLRWNSEARGVVAPAIFVPLAEESGLIQPVGAWVLKEACSRLRTWHEAGFGGLRVAVNVSAKQFLSPSFMEDVSSAVHDAGIEAGSLELEITESIAMQNSGAIATVFEALKDMGVRVAIDDFGTGYSSLDRLSTFPIHTLKVARPFVQSLASSRNGASSIAHTIVMLAHSMHLNAIAEGVETQEQFEALASCGCDEMQGFLFSQALPPEEILSLLQAGVASPRA